LQLPEKEKQSSVQEGGIVFIKYFGGASPENWLEN
jgi:hypothetical protein